MTPRDPAVAIVDSLKDYFPNIEFTLVETPAGFNAEYLISTEKGEAEKKKIRVQVLPSKYFVFDQNDIIQCRRQLNETKN